MLFVPLVMERLLLLLPFRHPLLAFPFYKINIDILSPFLLFPLQFTFGQKLLFRHGYILPVAALHLLEYDPLHKGILLAPVYPLLLIESCRSIGSFLLSQSLLPPCRPQLLPCPPQLLPCRPQLTAVGGSDRTYVQRFDLSMV